MSERADRRRYPRVRPPESLWVAWHSGGQREISRADSVGLGGLFLLTENPPPPGTMLQLLFEVPGGDVRARAVVRRTEPGYGMGIEFMAMSSEGRSRLQRMMKRLLR